MVVLTAGAALVEVLAAGVTPAADLTAGLEAREAVLVVVVAAELGCWAGAGTETGRTPSISCRTAHATAPVVAVGGPYFAAFLLIQTLFGARAESDGNLEEVYVHPITDSISPTFGSEIVLPERHLDLPIKFGSLLVFTCWNRAAILATEVLDADIIATC